MDSYIPLQENVPGDYESFDVITRLYCLQFLNFDLQEYVYYPPHLIFAGTRRSQKEIFPNFELKRTMSLPVLTGGHKSSRE